MARILSIVALGLIISLTKVNSQWFPNFVPGRTTIVHLFEWKWSQISRECEDFLGPYGYGGVQVSPPNENAVILHEGLFRPWWERYQPVSYKLETRSGSELEFQDMVRRCNAVGVRIYVDGVINHMTGSGLSGVGTGGSSFSGPNKQFPDYGPDDFNRYPEECPNPTEDISDYNNPFEVRNCRLVSLLDLKLSTDYVRSLLVEYLNRLISYGVAGFRLDASKHMWPGDMEAILSQLTNLPTSHGFPGGARPFIFQEVIDLGNEVIGGTEYFHLGRVTEFKYGAHLGRAFRGRELLKELRNWGEGWGMYPDSRALVFIDNHDNQRGHGAGGADILTFRDDRLYKMATAFELAHPYGVTRVMSSYFWAPFENTDIGPPDTNGVIDDVVINPDMTCAGDWICEHRWRQIYNMVKFRNVVEGTEIGGTWWDNGSNQIAFCRGNKGFIAINNDNFPLNENLQTCLPSGTYCDVISGNLENGSCSGTLVTVGSDGIARIDISNSLPDPVIAIHIEAKL